MNSTVRDFVGTRVGILPLVFLFLIQILLEYLNHFTFALINIKSQSEESFLLCVSHFKNFHLLSFLLLFTQSLFLLGPLNFPLSS